MLKGLDRDYLLHVRNNLIRAGLRGNQDGGDEL